MAEANKEFSMDENKIVPREKSAARRNPLPFIAATKAGFAVFGAPLFVIQTRLQSTTALSILNNQATAKNTFLEEFRAVAKNEGFKGFFRGFIPTTCLILFTSTAYQLILPSENRTLAVTASTGCALALITHPVWLLRNQFVVLPTLSNVACESSYGGVMKNMVAKKTFFTGAAAFVLGGLIFKVSTKPTSKQLEKKEPTAIAGLGVASYMVTYPLMTIACNQNILALQTKETFIDVAKRIYELRGFKGFYDGLGTRLMFFVPTTIALAVYGVFTMQN